MEVHQDVVQSSSQGASAPGAAPRATAATRSTVFADIVFRQAQPSWVACCAKAPPASGLRTFSFQSRPNMRHDFCELARLHEESNAGGSNPPAVLRVHWTMPGADVDYVAGGRRNPLSMALKGGVPLSTHAFGKT
eukprot:3644065-Rhodomonas_salina.2